MASLSIAPSPARPSQPHTFIFLELAAPSCFIRLLTGGSASGRVRAEPTAVFPAHNSYSVNS